MVSSLDWRFKPEKAAVEIHRQNGPGVQQARDTPTSQRRLRGQAGHGGVKGSRGEGRKGGEESERAKEGQTCRSPTRIVQLVDIIRLNLDDLT